MLIFFIFVKDFLFKSLNIHIYAFPYRKKAKNDIINEDTDLKSS